MTIRFLFIIVSALLFMSGCQSAQMQTPSPSDNSQLNTISPSGKPPQNKGYLQQTYDAWEKEKWEPATQVQTEKEKGTHHNIKPFREPDTETSDVNSSTSFTLQYYYEKWGRYLDEKEKQKTGSTHSERLEKMPVIGNE